MAAVKADAPSPAPGARLAALAACAGALQVAESLLPHPLPGVRLGLANVFTLVTIVELGCGSGLQLAVLRTLVSSLVLGTFLSPAFVLSLGGGVASAAVMSAVYLLARRLPGLGIIGVSVAGAAAHTLAQVALVYLLFIRSGAVLRLLPWLVVFAVGAGLLTGFVAAHALGRIARAAGGGQRAGSAAPDAGMQQPADPGPLGRVPPEYKVGAAAVVALFLVLAGGAWACAAVSVALIGAAAFGRVRAAALLSGLRRAWPLVGAALLVPALFSPWGRIVLQLGPVRITEAGLMQGALFAARLAVLLFAARLLSLVTAPADIGRGVARLLSPLRRFGLRPDSVGLAIGAAWAAFPSMMSRARQAVRARAAGRGLAARLVRLPGEVVADLYLAAAEDMGR